MSPTPPGPSKNARVLDRRPPPRRRVRRAWWSLLVVLPLLVLAALYAWHRRERAEEMATAPAAAPPPAVTPAQVNPWRAAAKLVEEERGKPIGRAARVQVPAELRHYADTRRFLATQVAAWKEKDYPIPHDEADLARMIEHGDLVEVPAVGDDYVLYGVGANATDEPLAHYNTATGDEIPLYAGWDRFRDAAEAWGAEIDARKAAAARVTAEAAALRKTETRRRRSLLAQAKQARQEAAALQRQRAKVAAWYEDYDRRRLLVSERETLDELARRLGPRPYDLDDSKDRRAFRGRLLSFIRPPARAMVLELAARYRKQFGRPLPVTSLVRTEAYQRLLGETNPNATRIAVPPHTTGLAFDVYYHYMPADEQDAFMKMVAEVKDAGRVEALRENRDHFHIFAFPEGRRPPEALIAEAMGIVRQPRVAAAAGTASARAARAASRSPRARVAARHTAAPGRTASVKRTGQRARRR